MIINLLFPLSYLEALCIAACITPTDPVLSNALVKGSYAEKHLPNTLRMLISAEAGANDGFGYPFLFLAVYLLKVPSPGMAMADWIGMHRNNVYAILLTLSVKTWLYQILFSIVYGIVIGLVARYLLRYAVKAGWVDDQAFFSFFLALSFFVIGTCGMIGTDDLLAAFVAGNAFTVGNFYRDKTEHDSFTHTLDALLNTVYFFWIGTTVPWTEMQAVDPGWKLIVMSLCILIFGRFPAILLLYRFIPQIKTIKEAVYAGWFGPGRSVPSASRHSLLICF